MNRQGERRGAIRTSLLRAIASLVVLSMAVLGASTFFFLRRTLVGTARENTRLFAAQLSKVIDDYVSYMDDIALLVMGNEDVKAYLAEARGPSPHKIERIASFLASIRAVRKDIDALFILPAGPEGVPEAGSVIASSPGGAVNPYFDFRSAFPGPDPESPDPRVSAARVQNLVEGRYPWVVSLSRRVAGNLGWVQVDLTYAVIERLCADIQLGSSGYVFIVDSGGDIVYHPRQQLVNSRLKTELIPEVLGAVGGFLEAEVDGRRLLYSSVRSPRTAWTVVAVSRVDELIAPSRDAEYVFLLLALLCFSFSVLVSYGVSRRISSPIESLRAQMQAVERGEFDFDIAVESRNEVKDLARDCDIAVKKIRDLLEGSRRDADRKRLLEIRALQAQINPHFLYNTLDSIIWMIELGEKDRAIEVTSSLARFFRLGISRGSEIIPIRTEAEYLETYLSIQKARYASRLDYSIGMEEAVLGLRIPKLLVQPLVENAIYHGIKNKEGPGFVRIEGRLDGDSVLIRVTDDGVGMGPERLAEVRAALESESGNADRPAILDTGGTSGGSGRLGVGVRNVIDRVRLYFGPGYGLSFQSERGSGTTAVLRIPALPEETTA